MVVLFLEPVELVELVGVVQEEGLAQMVVLERQTPAVVAVVAAIQGLMFPAAQAAPA